MKLSNLLLTSLIASSITTNCVAQKEKDKTHRKQVSKVEKDTVDIIYPPNGETVETSKNSKDSLYAPASKPFVNKAIKAIKPPKTKHRDHCPPCGRG